jgi:hypothetical protein
MPSPLQLIKKSHWLTSVGFLAGMALSVPSVCRADLLYAERQGGPDEYAEEGFSHTADFEVTVPTEINAISGWISGGGYFGQMFYDDPAMVGVSVESLDPDLGVYFSTTFPPIPLPSMGDIVAPAEWMGVNGLAWDLQPGAYQLDFIAEMPLAYGYDGPPDNVPGFYNFMDIVTNEPSELPGEDPFGARIYGEPLSAIPEPSTYGVAGVLVVVAAVMTRRRRALTAG